MSEYIVCHRIYYVFIASWSTYCIQCICVYVYVYTLPSCVMGVDVGMGVGMGSAGAKVGRAGRGCMGAGVEV